MKSLRRQIPAIFGVSSIIGSFDKKMPKRWHVPHIWNPNYFSHIVTISYFSILGTKKDIFIFHIQKFVSFSSEIRKKIEVNFQVTLSDSCRFFRSFFASIVHRQDVIEATEESDQKSPPIFFTCVKLHFSRELMVLVGKFSLKMVASVAYIIGYYWLFSFAILPCTV